MLSLRRLALLGLLLWSTAAAAGASKIEAKAYGTVPASGPIYLESQQHDALATWISDHMTQALEAKGYKVDSNAKYSLRFESALSRNIHEESFTALDWGDGLGYRDRFELGPRYGAPMMVQGEEADWKVGSMLFILRAQIFEPGKPPVWSGEVHHLGRFDDRLKIDAQITRELVDVIGQTLLREQ